MDHAALPTPSTVSTMRIEAREKESPAIAVGRTLRTQDAIKGAPDRNSNELRSRRNAPYDRGCGLPPIAREQLRPRGSFREATGAVRR